MDESYLARAHRIQRATLRDLGYLAQQEERLLQAIRRLPITYRQAITLSLEGMSYSEIAEILGVGESNVGVRLNRARNMLREMLEVGHERR